jgi:hypothetical protein
MTQLALGYNHRDWHGHLIGRREADGYVHASAMCKANGKRWPDYARIERAQSYIAALAAVVQIRTTGPGGLIQTIQGGQPHLQGTWVHPRLAVDLARWISPHFAVWMDGWILDSLAQPPQPPPPPQLPNLRPHPHHPIATDHLRTASLARLVWELLPVMDMLSHGHETPEVYTALRAAGLALAHATYKGHDPRSILRELSIHDAIDRLTGSALQIMSWPGPMDNLPPARVTLPRRRHRAA